MLFKKKNNLPAISDILNVFLGNLIKNKAMLLQLAPSLS